jgi:hypothetical protein
MRRSLPQAARRVAGSPQTLQRLAQPSGGAAPDAAPAPLARDPHLGHGRPGHHITGQRTFHIDGPATLTVTPR